MASFEKDSRAQINVVTALHGLEFIAIFICLVQGLVRSSDIM